MLFVLPKTLFSTSLCLANSYSFFAPCLNVLFSRKPSLAPRLGSMPPLSFHILCDTQAFGMICLSIRDRTGSVVSIPGTECSIWYRVILSGY